MKVEIQENTKRYNWIDWAKAIGIFLVIWGHIPLAPMNPMVKGFIYSFHMPLFFIISGYLFKAAPTFKLELQKDIKTLVIPYLIYQLLFYPYQIAKDLAINGISFDFYNQALSPIFQSLITNPINGPTWFILSLFFMKLTASFVLRQKYATIFILISCVFSISLCWYLNSQGILGTYAVNRFLASLSFFFLGYICKQKNIIECIINEPKKNSILLLLSLILTVCINNISFQTFYTSMSDVVMFYVVGISGSLMIISIGVFLNQKKSHIIYQLSVGTLVILGFHWIAIGVINFICEKAMHISDISYSFSTSLAIALLITALMYPIIILSKKYCPILLGKSHIK